MERDRHREFAEKVAARRESLSRPENKLSIEETMSVVRDMVADDKDKQRRRARAEAERSRKKNRKNKKESLVTFIVRTIFD